MLAYAVIALVLAAAGLYGVLAYLLTQRSRGIGIRIAIGAQRRQMWRVMLLDGIRPALRGMGMWHRSRSYQPAEIKGGTRGSLAP